MTDSQQEEKVIQLIDLHHFIECYDRKIIILNYLHHSINIIEDHGIRKGILFYDLKHSSPLDLNANEDFKRKNNLKELWFVFVEEDTGSSSHRNYTDFISENSIDIYYDRIFKFSFFQSIIHLLS
ncbi:hypothetical protein [Chryseobacterium soli]|uniref:hypothetical protein n=1 Tax=Chryseobacterium soli TaxID=445961 RepID=UPI002953CE08|nr:hypothetical protein [Chryseobacterium soli]